MKERPIIFSAPMVRAILDGSKTQTRRPVKATHLCSVVNAHGASREEMRDRRNMPVQHLPTGVDVLQFCPYGQRSDNLWVRETWRTYDGQAECACYDDCQCPPNGTVLYRAAVDHEAKWRPSIYMPRWASRITLEITGVRVERLQDISEADARKEGALCADLVTGREVLLDKTLGSYRLHYKDLWQSIHGPGSWDVNPWVWVIEFKRIEEAGK